eukprot:5632942-Pyramimonas_sp.AAC.1
MARKIAKEWTSVELKHAYQLEPEDDDTEFLCGEKVPQMPRGGWIQQAVMTRNGCTYSRTDNVAAALNEEWNSANESAIQRLYNKMYVDSRTVSWTTCKQDSQRNSRSKFDGPPQNCRSKNGSISSHTLTRAPR